MKTAFIVLFALVAATSHGSWPQFRGAGGNGIAPNASPPVKFGPESGVVWKTSLPPGNSSPCIVAGRIFLTGVNKPNLETICLSQSTGEILWSRTATPTDLEKAHRIGSAATPTPASDGKHVYVYFGSVGVICYDLDGTEVWRQSLPNPIVEFGTSTSPVLHQGRVILACDQDQGSYLTALDAKTGKTLWKTERPTFRRGFGTPYLWQNGGQDELIVPGTLRLISYDPATGAEHWSVRGRARLVCTTPVGTKQFLYAASWTTGGDTGASDRIAMPDFSQFITQHDKNNDQRISRQEMPPGDFLARYGQLDFNKDNGVTREEWDAMANVFSSAENSLIAIRPGGKGDITDTHVQWKRTRGIPYCPSPLYYQNRIYTIKKGGMISCFDAKTGEPHFMEERLGRFGDHYASPLAADGKIYTASERGSVVVLEASDRFTILAENKFKESIMATPAILGSRIYLRTRSALYCLE